MEKKKNETMIPEDAVQGVFRGSQKRFGFVTAEGQFLSKAELDEAQQDWLWRYEVLNYCGMVGLFDEARPMFYVEEQLE